MEAVTVEQFRDFFVPLLGAGPVHAIIVGDVELEAAVEAMRRTVGGAAAAARAAHPAPTRPRCGRRRPTRRRALHPSGRPQSGLCADRLVDAGRQRADPRAARAGARRQHVRDAAVRPAARGGGRDLFARRRPSRRRRLPRLGRSSTPRPRSGRRAPTPSSASPARSSPTSPPARRCRTSSRGRRIRCSAASSGGSRPTAIGSTRSRIGTASQRDIENVRTYLADYRALTAEDVRRAVATYVTDAGDWSMLVLPS